MNENQCKIFAQENGHSSHSTGSWVSDYPNCQGDQSGNIWFNTDTGTKGTYLGPAL
jgi:hypothetical protein